MVTYEVEYSNQKWIKVENDESPNVVYKIPYSSIRDGKDCPKIENNFIVYILHGITTDSKDYIYVGKSTKGLDNRPGSHDSKYDNWTYCYVLTRTDTKLFNDAVIQYLEDAIRRRVDECSDVFIDTTDKTSSNTANERDIKKSNAYLEDIYKRLAILGLELTPRSVPAKITDLDNGSDDSEAVRKPRKSKSAASGENVFHIHSPNVVAHAIVHSEKEVEVLAGSKIVPIFGVSLNNHSYGKLLASLKQKGVIKNAEFTTNYVFTSLSAASSVILGRASNGRIEWVNENNIPYAKLK